MHLVKMLFSKLAGKPIETQGPGGSSHYNPEFIVLVARRHVACNPGLFFRGNSNCSPTGQDCHVGSGSKRCFCYPLLCAMCITGVLEGMQIAFFAVTKLPKEEQGQHPVAIKTRELLFTEGCSLRGFMIGRKICVTMYFFIVARVTTLDVDADNETVFGRESSILVYLALSLQRVLRPWQLEASAFRVALLSNPLALCSQNLSDSRGYWYLLSGIGFRLNLQRLVGFQLDERAARHKEDHDEELHLGSMWRLDTRGCQSSQLERIVCLSCRTTLKKDLKSKNFSGVVGL
jgi:hypothetical protein